MRIFVCTLQNIRHEIERIGRFGCFQSDGDETEKPSPLEFMHTFEEDSKKAQRYAIKSMCYSLCKDRPSEYDYLYNQMEIIALYEYAALRQSNYHANKK